MSFPYKTLNLLFLCGENAASSILAEGMVNTVARGRFRAYSGGPRPAGKIHPMALETLRRRSVATLGLRSKSWLEFEQPHAPVMDIVITLAAGAETAPRWPGDPLHAHWLVDDPSAAAVDEAAGMAVFEATYDVLRRRVSRLIALPLHNLSRPEISRELARIGALP